MANEVRGGAAGNDDLAGFVELRGGCWREWASRRRECASNNPPVLTAARIMANSKT